MAEKIKINTKTLSNDTESLQKHLNQVQKKIEAMLDDVSEMNNMWSGSANDAFNRAFQEDIKLLMELSNSLQEIIYYEATARKEYDDCENKIASLIASMSV